MTPIVIANYDDLRGLLGRDLGCGDWFEIGPDQADRFAAACKRDASKLEDVRLTSSPRSERLSPLLLLSLLGRLRSTMEGVKFAYPSTMNIFYGYDNVRFLDPLAAPATIRLNLKVVDAKLLDDRTIHAVYGHRLEASDGRVALTADVINRIHLRRTVP